MSKDKTSSFDVAIVGGGIVGCATAWQLATRGIRVAVFERGKIASEQSSRAWGFIRQQGRHEAEVPLAAEANQMWIELTERYGRESTQFTPTGIMVPAETVDDEERVISGHDIAAKFKLDTRILKRDEIHDLVPELAGSWRSALYTPGDAHGDPGLSTRTIAAAARAAGAEIFEDTPVYEVEMSAGKVAGVHAASGYHQVTTVLLASGIGTPSLAGRLGLSLPIQITKSSVGMTMPAAPFTKVAMWGPHVAYRPRPDGSFTLGNGYRGMGMDYEITVDSFRSLRHFLPAYRRNWKLLKLTLGRDFFYQLRAKTSRKVAAHPFPEPIPNERKVNNNLKRFRELFPHLGDVPLSTMWAGRIDLTPDAIPIIDQPDPARRLFIAAGFSGHGFALGPSIGLQVAQWIADGKTSLDLKPFRLARFEQGEAQRAQQAL
ncbi:NAD(P)/FAD-dependent oxidoreductase [Microvirga roseola]|uniref:NAD(P)/FAD-dependent oxidoreductase n=1 Tax=Microvirga roseola TaxID=2883126 RepID=UPI001E465600|nr:FAD-dependent oxidoreductase [Microvirga roseola]